MHPSERPAPDEPRCETLVSLLRWRAHVQPDALAYAFVGPAPGAPSLTYGELDRRARAFGRRLQSLAADGERALLLFPPGLQFIEAFFGCLYAGGVAVPAAAPSEANLRRSLPRLSGIARDARAAFVLTTQSLRERLGPVAPELGARHWLAPEDASPEGAERWQAPPLGAESLAFLQYTSGSTGSPKGVMVSHANVLHNSAYIRQGFQHSEESVGVCWLPSFHDMGLIDGIIQPLYSGFPCHLMSPAAFVQHPLAWLEAVSRLRATHSGGPDFAYDLCVRRTRPEERAALDLSRWAVAYTGAEPVRLDTLERFREAFAVAGFRARALYPCYGLAEATLKVSGGRRGQGHVTCHARAAELERHRVEVVEGPLAEPGLTRALVGCGQVSGGVEVAIVHPEGGRRCADDEVGEIWVAGPSVAKGYWGKPEETERTFHARLEGAPGGDERRFLRTGDLGFLRGGELFITGRLKDLIIVDGRNHYPHDLEHAARASHPRLQASTCAAFGVEQDGAERVVVAIEVGRQELRRLDLPAEPEASEGPGPASGQPLGGLLVRAIRRALAEQHDVAAHRVLLLRPGAIPKTSSGKVQRRSCRARFLEGELEPLFDDRAATPDRRGGEPGPEGRESRPSARAVGDWLAARLGALLGGATAIDHSRPLAELGLGSRD
ncbi:MAG TPA: fatty acyl-AMP ligase, partial [Polyangiaceae bacterium]|nr:fatty acyl-AMP ligase [Polyangiaceae bacterium]